MSLLAVFVVASLLPSAARAVNHETIADHESIQWIENVNRPHVGPVPYGTIINHCKSPGLVALAFHDGPWVHTNQLLDLLDQLGVHATFFVTGDNLGKGRIDDCSLPWPSIIHRIHDSGHQIASHTWTHQNLNHVNRTTQETEMLYNEIAFRNLFGWFPTYARPPYLECTATSGCEGVLGNLGYHVITSNLDTKDYLNDGPSQIHESKDIFAQGISKDSGKDSYIILAHDTLYQTVTNLTDFMVHLAKSRGYKLTTVGECLGDLKENWYRSVSNGNHSCSSTSRSVTTALTTSTEFINTTPSASVLTADVHPTLTKLAASAQTGAASNGMRLGTASLRYIFSGATVSFLGVRLL